MRKKKKTKNEAKTHLSSRFKSGPSDLWPSDDKRSLISAVHVRMNKIDGVV